MAMPHRLVMFEISPEPLDPQGLVARLAHPEAGALATFEGWVRRHNDGWEVTGLEYEAYAELAGSEGRRILEQAVERFDLLGACCVHRVGALGVGDLAVWVGTTAEHRPGALQACAFIIDEIKARVPIWKKEHYASGEAVWVNCRHGAAAHAHDTRRSPA